MSDDTKTGGAGDQNSGATSDKEKNTVAHETYVKVMDELKETQRKLKEIQDKSKITEEQKLKEQGDWKTLAESREKQVKELEEKNTSTEQAINDSIKLNAFQKFLGGKLKSDKYFDFVETSEIAFDPTTRKVDEASVKLVVAKFLKEHSSLVDFGKKPGMPMDTKLDVKISDGKKSTADMTAKELEQHIIELGRKGLIK